MTGPRPVLPRAKSLEGTTFRELESYERTVDDGEEVPPPGGLPDPPSVDLAFHAVGGWRRRLVQQSAAATEYWRASRPKFDASAFTHVRLVVQVRVAGAEFSHARLMYSTDDGATWAHPGVSGTEVVVSFADASDGDIVGFSVPLAAGARADVHWGVVAVDGDGVESPEIARLSAQFFTRATAATVRLYWRPAAAGVVLDTPALVDRSRVFTPIPIDPEDCACPPVATPFVSTFPADPLGDPMTLSLMRGASSAGLLGNTDGSHVDWYGHVGRFLYGPLAAQTMPACVVVVGGVGSVTSANPEGGGIGYGVGIYDPDTDTVLASGTWKSARPGFRFAGRARIGSIGLPETVIPAGSYVILDVALTIEMTCGCTVNAASQPVAAGYDGNYDGFVHDEDMTGQSAASYVDLPRLRLQ